MAVRDRVEVVDDLEARAVLAAGEPQVVHRGHVHEQVEAEGRVVPAEGERGQQAFAGHHRGVVPAVLVRGQDAVAQALAQPGQDGGTVHVGRIRISIAGCPPRSCPGASSGRR